MSVQVKRTFTWEGRCYGRKYENKDLLNITLCVYNESIDWIVSDIKEKFGTKIILWDRQWDERWDDFEESDLITFITLVIEEKQKDEFFRYLKILRFTQI